MRAVPVRATLADHVWPSDWALARQRDLILIFGFSLLMIASARVSFTLPAAVGAAYQALLQPLGVALPGTPVPVSGQTFAVLLAGLTLGSRRGALSMLTYLGYGLAGLGVFALGQSAWTPSAIPGVPVILGPTAGYLVGFPLAAFVTGWLAERGLDRRGWAVMLSALAGSLVIYACGVGWLARYVGPAAPLAGLVPFLPGDLLKLLAAGGLLPATWRLLRALGLVADQ